MTAIALKQSLRDVGVGIDTGGTFTKIVATTRSGRKLGELQVPTQPGRGPREFVRRAAEAARRLARELGAVPKAAGLGLAGDVDRARGMLRHAPNLREFVGFPFKPALKKLLGVRVTVDNDANMAAWGGYVVELERRAPNLLCVTLGTGIGGGLVLDGRLHHGATGTAGEIGHTCVEDNGELCRCGARGCLEAYAGTYGILRMARKLLAGPRGGRSLLKKLSPDPGDIDPELLALAAERGDRVARTVWRLAGYYLGLGIGNAVYLVNPDAVLLVGGVSLAGRLILDPLLEVLRSRPITTPFKGLRVSIARTPRLGALGAALAALESDAR